MKPSPPGVQEEREDEKTGSLANAVAMHPDYLRHVPGLFFTWRMDADGRMSIPYLAGAIDLLAGIQPQQVVDSIEPLLVLCPADDADAIRACFCRSARELAPLELRFRVFSETDKAVMLEIKATPCRNETIPGATEWHGFMHAVTSAERDQQHESEWAVHFDTALDRVPIPIYCKNKQGQYTGGNKAFEKFFGWTNKQIVGKSAFDLFPRDIADYHSARDEELFSRGGIQHFEYVVEKANGDQRDVSFHKAVLRDAKGDVTGLIGAILDITERKQAEDKLKEALEFEKSIIAAIPDILFEVDGAGRYLNVWTRSPELLAQSRELLLGKTVEEVLLPEEAEAARKAIMDAEKEDVVFGRVIPITQPNGEVRWFEHSLAKCRVREGETETYLVLSRDITARQEAERQLVAAKETAELANRAKNEFLANMSHELRTPLNAIIGFSAIMKDEIFGEIGNLKYKEYCHDIFRSGEHLLQLISDILDIARVEAGRITLQEEALSDVGQLADACLNMLETSIAKKNLTIVRDFPGLPIQLYADRLRVRQILLNLLSNAVKFTEPGGVITVSISKSDEGQVVVAVADTGIGIPAGELERVLEPFGQVETASTRKQDGVGLGLPLSMSLANLHGASLELASEEGIGTQVTVTFPAIRSCSENT